VCEYVFVCVYVCMCVCVHVWWMVKAWMSCVFARLCPVGECPFTRLLVCWPLLSLSLLACSAWAACTPIFSATLLPARRCRMTITASSPPLLMALSGACLLACVCLLCVCVCICVFMYVRLLVSVCLFAFFFLLIHLCVYTDMCSADVFVSALLSVSNVSRITSAFSASHHYLLYVAICLSESVWEFALTLFFLLPRL